MLPLPLIILIVALIVMGGMTTLRYLFPTSKP
jgi:hypothetical protein